MAADLFESYAVTLVAALILGKAAFGNVGLVFPLLVPAIGVITAVIGIFAVTPRAGDRSGMTAINRGFFISAIVSAVLVAIVASSATCRRRSSSSHGVVVRQPRLHQPPTASTRASSRSAPCSSASCWRRRSSCSPATSPRPTAGRSTTSPRPRSPARPPSILAGISRRPGVGRLLRAAHRRGRLRRLPARRRLGHRSSLFAIALAGCGLLTTVGVIVVDGHLRPGLRQRAGHRRDVRRRRRRGRRRSSPSLDAVGNTTKAITKGIAIATAVLAATALFGSFRDTVVEATQVGHRGRRGSSYRRRTTMRSTGASSTSPTRATWSGLIIGAAVVFLFSGLAINAVSRAAGAVIFEVRRQFRDHPGIMDDTEKPEYGQVVDICTRDSLRELVTPGLLAVLTPIAVGFGLGVGALGAYLAGTIATGIADGGLPGQLRWRLGQREEVRRGRQLRRQGLRRPTRPRSSATPSATRSRTPPARPSTRCIKVMNLVALLIAPAIVACLPRGQRVVRAAASRSSRSRSSSCAVVVAKTRPIAVGDDPESSTSSRTSTPRTTPELHPELAGGEEIGEGGQRCRHRRHGGRRRLVRRGLRASRRCEPGRAVVRHDRDVDVDRAAAARSPCRAPRRRLHRRRPARAARRLGVRRARPRRAGARPARARRGCTAPTPSSRGCSCSAARRTAARTRRATCPLADLIAARAGRPVPATVRAAVDVRPYGESDTDWYVVSDHGPDSAGHDVAEVAADHVLGVGGASLTLARLAPRDAGRPRARPRHRVRGAGAAPRPARAVTSSRPTATGARCGSPR